MSVKRKVTVPDGSTRDTAPHDRRSGGVTKGTGFRGLLRQSTCQTSRERRMHSISLVRPGKSRSPRAVTTRTLRAVDKPNREPARPVPPCRGRPRAWAATASVACLGPNTSGCKRSASIRLPRRCHRVPPKCNAVRLSGLESAFPRNTAERVYTIEAAHNPEVAGSNPAPATRKAPETGPFSCGSPALCPCLQAFDTPLRPWCDPGTWLSTAQLK
jgi:hypothetical protein